MGDVSGERYAGVVHDLEHGLLVEATLVLVRDFADQVQAVFTRRRQDYEQLGALLLDLSFRVSPLTPRIEDGETIREPGGHCISEERGPRRVIHDLAGLVAAAHEELVFHESVGAIRTSRRSGHGARGDHHAGKRQENQYR